jgi:hypothetical protein
MSDTADGPDATPPTMPIGPPPVGLVISSLLDWQVFSRTYPGMDRYWQPADGRELPQDSVLAHVLASHGQPTLRLPDLRGAVLRGATASDSQAPAPLRLATASDGDGDAGIGTQAVHFYVRIN